MSKKSKLEWCDRTLIRNPYYFALTLNEKDFQRELKRLKLPRKDWPPFLKTAQANATLHYFSHIDNKVCGIVCLGNTKGRTLIEIHGLLVHEAVHLWQAIIDHLGDACRFRSIADHDYLLHNCLVAAPQNNKRPSYACLIQPAQRDCSPTKPVLPCKASPYSGVDVAAVWAQARSFADG